MSVTFSFSAKPEHMPAIQQVVKAAGMRFKSNPAALMHHDTIWVEVGYDGSDAGEYRDAVAAINAIREPKPEPAKPRIRWWSRIFPAPFKSTT
jgi:hypothetical protein